MLALILLTSLAQNFGFVMVVLAIVLVRLCLLQVAQLKRAVIVAAGAALLALLLMLPALLMENIASPLTLPAKVFISVSFVMIFSLTTPFHEITASLKAFRIPGIIIMTTDLALKYIVRLGEVANEVLAALSCRSVGRDAAKATSIGGVLGVTFIKSQELALMTHESMICRGFTGEYDCVSAPKLKVIDALWVALIVGLLALFLLMEGVIA